MSCPRINRKMKKISSHKSTYNILKEIGKLKAWSKEEATLQKGKVSANLDKGWPGKNKLQSPRKEKIL